MSADIIVRTYRRGGRVVLRPASTLGALFLSEGGEVGASGVLILSTADYANFYRNAVEFGLEITGEEAR